MNGTLGNGCGIRCRPRTKIALFATLRLQLGLPEQAFFTDRGFGSLGFLEQQAVGQALAPAFSASITRSSATRSCADEQRWKKPACWSASASRFIPIRTRLPNAYAGVGFDGLGLLTNHPFDLAYQAAEALRRHSGSAEIGRPGS